MVPRVDRLDRWHGQRLGRGAGRLATAQRSSLSARQRPPGWRDRPRRLPRRIPPWPRGRGGPATRPRLQRGLRPADWRHWADLCRPR